jgi:hypothetical protein
MAPYFYANPKRQMAIGKCTRLVYTSILCTGAPYFHYKDQKQRIAKYLFVRLGGTLLRYLHKVTHLSERHSKYQPSHQHPPS